MWESPAVQTTLRSGAATPAVKRPTGSVLVEVVVTIAFSIDGFDAPKLANYLWQKYRIWTVGIVTPGEYQGLRITPNVYTTIEEIDTFTETLAGIIKKGSIPSV